jgi:hypothetical protein
MSQDDWRSGASVTLVDRTYQTIGGYRSIGIFSAKFVRDSLR